MNTIDEKGLPANLDAERFVLGSILLDGSRMNDLRGLFEEPDLSIDKHRKIWTAACALYDAGGAVDRVTVAEELARRDWLESCDGLTYLVSLDDGLPYIPNLSSYIQIIKDKAMLRRIAFAANHLFNRALAAEETPQTLIEAAGTQILDLAPRDEKRGFISAAELLDTRGINSLLSPRLESGIKLPWESMQKVLCGLQPEQLILLAGQTSSGKTSAALQVAIEAARKGVGVAMFSLEMSTESLFRRMVYQVSKIDAERHRHGKPTAEERQRMSMAANEIHGLPIHWNDTACFTVPSIHAAARKLMMREDIGLFVVDFLQIVRGTGRQGSRNEEVGGNSRALKLCAKEFGTPFLVLSQLSRKPGMEKRPPQLSDLRDSGEIEENSDVVWFVHRCDSEPGSSCKPSQFIIGKQREGPRDVSIDMLFIGESQRFEEMDGRA